MLRDASDLDDADVTITRPPDGPVSHRPGQPQDDQTPLATLELARMRLETALDANDDWRAMRQLEAREAAGEWLDVMESDALRQRLTQALAAHPEFMAWQFADAAIACLHSGGRAATAAASAMTAIDAEFQPAADAETTAATQPVTVATAPPAEPAATPLIPVTSHALAPPPVAAAPEQDEHVIRALPMALPSPPTRGLSQRIPTLLPHDTRATDLQPIERMLALTTLAPDLAVHADALRATADAEATHFDPHAIGADEAEVQIVTRTPTARPLLNTRLPPLPLGHQPLRPTRPSRSPVAKWADTETGQSDDYRPIGSALDEAQVTIIAVAADNEAKTRAERRALGVAPDRENQMRRFLKALSGE